MTSHNSNLFFLQGLNDVQVYNGVPPPPPSEPCPSLPSVCPAPGSLGGPPPQLAPPPGFSDSDSQHSMSDTDSLGSEPGPFNRFGFSRVSKPRSLAQDRMMPQVSVTWKMFDDGLNQTDSHNP